MSVKHVNLDLSQEEFIFLKSLKGEKDWKTFIIELAKIKNSPIYYSKKINEIKAEIKEYLKDDQLRSSIIEKLMDISVLIINNKIDEAEKNLREIEDELNKKKEVVIER